MTSADALVAAGLAVIALTVIVVAALWASGAVSSRRASSSSQFSQATGGPNNTSNGLDLLMQPSAHALLLGTLVTASLSSGDPVPQFTFRVDGKDVPAVISTTWAGLYVAGRRAGDIVRLEAPVSLATASSSHSDRLDTMPATGSGATADFGAVPVTSDTLPVQWTLGTSTFVPAVVVGVGQQRDAATGQFISPVLAAAARNFGRGPVAFSIRAAHGRVAFSLCVPASRFTSMCWTPLAPVGTGPKLPQPVYVLPLSSSPASLAVDPNSWVTVLPPSVAVAPSEEESGGAVQLTTRAPGACNILLRQGYFVAASSSDAVPVLGLSAGLGSALQVVDVGGQRFGFSHVYK